MKRKKRNQIGATVRSRKKVTFSLGGGSGRKERVVRVRWLQSCSSGACTIASAWIRNVRFQEVEDVALHEEVEGEPHTDDYPIELLPRLGRVHAPQECQCGHDDEHHPEENFREAIDKPIGGGSPPKGSKRLCNVVLYVI